MKRYFNSFLMILLFALVFAMPQTRAEAAGAEVQYLLLTHTEGGQQAAVISVEGEGRIQSAKLSYHTGGSGRTQKADLILDHYLVFYLEGEISEQNLKSLNLSGTIGNQTIDLKSFANDSGNTVVELDPDQRSMSRGTALSEAQEQQVNAVTAESSSGIGTALAEAESLAGTASSSLGRSRSKNGSIVIVLDPGHGGSDPGATRTWSGVSYIEKDIALKISQYTKQELEKYQGVEVYLTRESDVYVGLEDRVTFAKNKGAAAIISQHINSTNANRQTSVSGAMVFVANGNYRPDLKSQSWALAQTILDELGKLGMDDRGLVVTNSQTGNTYPDGSLADYYAIVRHSVLKGLPGMIVEHGFVNNPNDCVKYYGSESALQKIGAADAKAIADYFGLTKEKPASGFYSDANGSYYILANGKRATGFVDINNNRYYFDANGYMADGWQKIGKFTYYFEHGVMQKGLHKEGKKLYWLNRRGRLEEGWFQGFDGNQYYADKNGVLKTGFVERKGKTYYFDPETGAMAKKWKTIGRYRYYFKSATGEMLKSQWKYIGKSKYYFDSKGRRRTGFKMVNGKKYFLDKTTGALVRSRWLLYKNNYYYVSYRGVVYSNCTVTINKRRYKFNAEGICTNRKYRSGKKVAKNVIVVK